MMIELTPLNCDLPMHGKFIVVKQVYKVLIDDHLYTIMPGFHSDGASIPNRLGFRRIVGSPLTGPYRNQAVIHDGIYRQDILIDGLHITINPVSRKDGDDIFNEAMMGHVEWWRRNLIYQGVRVGGRSSWQGPKGKKIW